MGLFEDMGIRVLNPGDSLVIEVPQELIDQSEHNIQG